MTPFDHQRHSCCPLPLFSPELSKLPSPLVRFRTPWHLDHSHSHKLPLSRSLLKSDPISPRWSDGQEDTEAPPAALPDPVLLPSVLVSASLLLRSKRDFGKLLFPLSKWHPGPQAPGILNRNKTKKPIYCLQLSFPNSVDPLELRKVRENCLEEQNGNCLFFIQHLIIVMIQEKSYISFSKKDKKSFYALTMEKLSLSNSACEKELNQ